MLGENWIKELRTKEIRYVIALQLDSAMSASDFQSSAVKAISKNVYKEISERYCANFEWVSLM